MSGKSVVLDTNVIVAHFRTKKGHEEAFGDLRLHLPHVVVAELFAGAFKSDRPDHNRGLVETFLRTATLLTPDLHTAEIYGKVWADLATDGRMIPQNDIWVAAAALQSGMPLVTNDAHFGNVDGLEIESL